MLESGKSNEVPGESAPDDAGECKPDPTALLRTQDLLKQCKEDAAGAGIKNVSLGKVWSGAGWQVNPGMQPVDGVQEGGHRALALSWGW